MGKATLALLLLAGLVVCLTVETSKAEKARKSLSDAVDDETSADLALSRETREAKRRRQSKSKKSKDVKRRRRNNKFGRKQQKRNKKNKKVQKGNKNKTRGRAKGRSGKKRNNNKEKKGKKSKQNKKKGRNDKKAKKSQKNRGKKGVRRQQQTRQQADTCIADLARLAGVFGNQARNVYRQAGRVYRFVAKKESKLVSKDWFKAQADSLLSTLGGNSSDLSCSDSSSNSNAIGSFAHLQNCSTEIETACPLPSKIHDDAIDCQLAAEIFRARFTELFVWSKTTDQICTGTKDVMILDHEGDVRDCVTPAREAEAAQKKEWFRCSIAYRNCQREERNLRNHVNICMATRPTNNATLVPTSSSTSSATATGSVAQTTTSAVTPTANPGKNRR